MPSTILWTPGSAHPLVGPDPASVVYRTSSDLVGSYASVADLDEISVPENSVHDFRKTAKERWLRIASRRFDSHLGQRFRVPLSAYSDAVVWAVCEMAFAGLVGKRGHDPEAKTEKTVKEREEEAKQWIQMAQDYEVTPDPRLVLTEPAPVAQMRSDLPRGWSGFSARDVLLGARGRGGGFFGGGR